MRTTITNAPGEIDWLAEGGDRAAQNVRNLIRLWQYEILLDQRAGINPDILDLPVSEGARALEADIRRVIGEREPGADVLDVFIALDTAGRYAVSVELEVAEA